jgi:hypothetical protein
VTPSTPPDRSRAGFAGSRPWHLLFAPWIPILIFFRAAASGAAPHSIPWPLAAMLLLVVALWIPLALALRDGRRSALVATTLAVAAWGYFLASDLASAAGNRLIIVPVYLVALAAVIALLRVGSRTIARTTTLANVASFAAVIALAALIVGDEARAREAAAADRPDPLPLEAIAVDPPRPDVVVLVLEGYGREDVLRSYYTHEDTLARELRSLGFFVADRAAGNYPHKGQSFASALNLAYLQDLMAPEGRRAPWRRRLGELIAHNRLFATMHAAGYRIRSYESEYAFLRPQPADARPAPLVRFTNFEYRLYEGSVFPRLLQAAGRPRGWVPAAVHRHHIRWVLDHLSSEPIHENDPPTFVFAHLLVPHPPFAFTEDGGPRPTRLVMAFNDADPWRDLARDTGESYEAGYIDSVKFLSARVPEVVRAILNGARRPTIIYVHSSHGPASRLEWERPTPTSVRERLGILFAARFPDGDASPLHPRITPVNAYRVLVNRALGAGLPLLDDRSYFSTWDRLSTYADVTREVQ